MQPDFLKEGDLVYIVSPAKKIEANKVLYARKLLQSWGLEVQLGRGCAGEHYYFSGSDQERIDDFQSALNDPNCKAVICTRGGYGSVRIIDQLDFSGFGQSPKWIVGFSDITVFHSHVTTNLDVQTIHGTVPLNYNKNEESVETLRKALFGEKISFEIEPSKFNRAGTARGEVVGGNLSIISSLTGTNSDIDTKGKILFLEEISEYGYKIDRMLWQLKKAGKLDQLAGLVIGYFTDIKQSVDVFGMNWQELVLEKVKEFDFPVLFDFPAGHEKRNLPLYMGREADLTVTAQKSILTYG
jgi:muramoyltetrapeptide carboxypeptidase